VFEGGADSFRFFERAGLRSCEIDLGLKNRDFIHLL
jgi:hypothetical protein